MGTYAGEVQQTRLTLWRRLHLGFAHQLLSERAHAVERRLVVLCQDA